MGAVANQFAASAIAKTVVSAAQIEQHQPRGGNNMRQTKQRMQCWRDTCDRFARNVCAKRRRGYEVDNLSRFVYQELISLGADICLNKRTCAIILARKIRRGALQIACYV